MPIYGILVVALALSGAFLAFLSGRRSTRTDSDGKELGTVSLVFSAGSLATGLFMTVMVGAGLPAPVDRNFGMFTAEVVYKIEATTPVPDGFAYLIKKANDPASNVVLYESSTLIPGCFMYTPDADVRFTPSSLCKP
ncbi:hypothetical protein HY091_01875 [Candidatus Kaiserbacteria bacterium]|nr:hypothetical protein [Candidatus Kaiserbacteria bacterium]